ncbi:DUF3500 domain-containing protein [Mycobacterium antarcticum]|uniref:DUF3500 domain-containing protein n=1 Tax=Mycolicibacterium sp. TUM20984 TaxID=3023368 RepID=UPI00238E14A3|nr:DUF3500 domain-containing protein [Mycolicibacterium sp. TUM20984]GLP81021.1 hypothetical protein TUM20984_24410 [Mycolicibacterium sp. TUM20984]
MRTTNGGVAAAAVMLALVSGCGGDTGGQASSSTTASVHAGVAASATLAASEAFLATLLPQQLTDAVVDRTSVNLAHWSNLPDGIFARAGVRMDTLTQAQRQAALAILRAALSPAGYQQVEQITTADGVLAATATGEHPDFGADHYWIRFVGRPSATDPYTIEYGGHHLALNVTVKGAAMTTAPTLWGAQPATYEHGASEVEPLSGETKKAFAVMDSLDATQQRQALLDTPMKEIVLGPGQDGKQLAPEGAHAATFTDAQKATLLDLITEWLTTLNTENSTAKVAKAKAEINDTTFAWSGQTTIGNPIYYRVQSPSFVIEFAHQQGKFNQQPGQGGGITHIHSIYRELGNDYAGDSGN